MNAGLIQTERLVLRLLQVSDAHWIAAQISQPDVHRMLTTPPHPYRLEDAREWIERVANTPSHRVIERAGEPLGVVTCDASDRTETLGYWLKPSAWGQGIMTEAAGAMLAAHFAAEAVEASSGYILENLASARVLAKLGFVPGLVVGRHSHYHGREVSIRQMHLSRAVWAR